MPRVSTDTTDETTKRAPRKRAVRRVVTKTETAVARKPRSPRTPRDKADDVGAPAPVVASSRRAPTQLDYSSKKSPTKKYAVVLGLMSLMLAGAAWIGFSDVGQIDVTARINEQKQKKSIATQETNPTTGESITVPVQNTPPAAISNLQPRTDAQPTEIPVPVVASTTEEIASSTDASAEGEVVTEEVSETSEAEAEATVVVP